MKSLLICLLFCLITLKTNPINAETYFERWLGLWVGEGQVGPHPDFNWRAKNDFILILPANQNDSADFVLYADTNWAERSYGGIGPIQANAIRDVILVTDGTCSVSLTLNPDNNGVLENDYLDASDNNNCGGINARISGLYKRFSKKSHQNR